MSVVIALILVAVLGVLLGTSLALVRSRKQRDATLLEPPPGAPGVPESVKDDVARHKAELEAQIEAEEAAARRGPRGTGQAPVPGPAGQGPHPARRLRRLDPLPGEDRSADLGRARGG